MNVSSHGKISLSDVLFKREKTACGSAGVSLQKDSFRTDFCISTEGNMADLSSILTRHCFCPFQRDIHVMASSCNFRDEEPIVNKLSSLILHYVFSPQYTNIAFDCLSDAI